MNILLDMDGVIADFNAGALEATGIPLTSDQIDTWDWFKPYMSSDEFYRRINDRMYFWEDLPVLPWAQELVQLCRSYGKVWFASSPGLCEEAPTGKLRWLRRHGFLGPNDMNYMFGHDKWLMASGENVLIDDSDIQMMHYWGSLGAGILFPRKWNMNAVYAADPVKFVKEALKARKEIGV